MEMKKYLVTIAEYSQKMKSNNNRAEAVTSAERMNDMTTNEYWLFLEDLRRTGITNMFGAAPYLMNEFGLSKQEAQKILIEWMKNYDPNDYK